ncbi:MAG: hypothetical protein JW829_10910 [Pirellulales bacterium]|nr:hypothetical protein [Pirellulales bacterium]
MVARFYRSIAISYAIVALAVIAYAQDEIQLTTLNDALASNDALAGGDCSACAGYKNGFYIKTQDDAWLLTVRALLQLRWIGDWRDLNGAGNPAIPGDSDEFVGGFTVHRGNVLLIGNIGDPKLKYWFIFASARDNGNTALEEGKLMYEFDNGMVLSVGQWHNSCFLREQDVSYTRQMGAERSYLTETFTLNEIQAILLSHQRELIRWQAQFSDGRYSGNHANRDFYADRADAALTGRLETKLAGEWAQFGDFTSWECEDWGVLLGGAVHWERGETGNNTPIMNLNNFWQWTGDVSIEGYGLSLYGAAVGRISQNPGEDINQYGFEAQAAYHLIQDELELFCRYENIFYDGVADIGDPTTMVPIIDNSVNILSLGLNRYYNRHAAKLTTEVLYAADPISIPMPQVGLLRDQGGQDGQWAVRCQMQLFF